MKLFTGVTGFVGGATLVLGYYYRFMATGPEVFDNRRLLDEGMPAPLPYPDYIARCVESSRATSIY